MKRKLVKERKKMKLGKRNKGKVSPPAVFLSILLFCRACFPFDANELVCFFLFTENDIFLCPQKPKSCENEIQSRLNYIPQEAKKKPGGVNN